MDEVIFDVESLAEYLRVEPKTIEYLSDTKRLPYFKVGRCIRFRLLAIIKWIERHEVYPDEPHSYGNSYNGHNNCGNLPKK